MTVDSYIQPPPLEPGDTLGVCAPSGTFDHDIFIRGIRVVESMGFHAHIPHEIYEKKRYMAGDEQVRAGVINTLFEKSDIDGIICARGGFGALRILEHIDYDLIKRNPKLFVGFSDVTALLAAISDRAHMQVVHGPVVTTLAHALPETVNSLYRELTSSAPCSDMAINSGDETLDYVSEIILNHGAGKTLRGGVASGRFTGGNLATLCHLTGTPFQPDLDGTILFLEDVGEPPYKVDRMLSQMKLAGLLRGVRGVVLGSFEGYNHKVEVDNNIRAEGFESKRDDGADGIEKKMGMDGEARMSHIKPKVPDIDKRQELIEKIILEIFDSPQQPVMSGLEAGHGKINLSLRFSATVQINTEEKKIIWRG